MGRKHHPNTSEAMTDVSKSSLSALSLTPSLLSVNLPTNNSCQNSGKFTGSRASWASSAGSEGGWGGREQLLLGSGYDRKLTPAN